MRRTLPALLTVLVCAPVLLACAAVGKKDVRIRIADESAIIVWDPKSKTEHFIRHSRFQTTGYDFGFLVPTPSQPELAPASEELFTSLEVARRPREVTERPLFGFFLSTIMRGSALKKDTPGVRVLEEKELSGYNAAVLEADSPEGLNDWLGKHGYPSRPSLVKWLEPYIKAKWKITAFKIAGNPGEGKAVKTSPVRMSFKADRPFYPYREPEDANAIAAIEGKNPNRLLRVFFIGEERMEGRIGEEGEQDWPGRVDWSAPLPEQHYSFNREKWLEASKLPANSLPEKLWMTVFTDSSSPRPTSDEVYFRASAKQSPIEPKPIVHDDPTPIIPLELVIAGVLFIGMVALVVKLVRLRRS